MRLKGKVIIVTGSCTGIGKAIAKRAVEEGAKVVIHGLEKELGEAVVAELGEENAVLHIEEVTNPNAPANLVNLAVRQFKRLDAVVNNAAYIPTSNILTTSEKLFNQVMAINTLAPLRLIQAALPQLLAARGSVLNIGSVNAWCGEPDLLAYSISKGALMTLTRNLGDTLFREYGIRVNQINPGWVLTEREAERKQAQGLPATWYEGIARQFAPAGRLLTPDEMAYAAIYWLSDESGPISGSVVDLEQYPLIGRNPPKN